MSAHLRPIERRILSLRDEGLPVTEIAERFKRSPDNVERIIGWTEIPRSGPVRSRRPRPIEQRVLALRARGETHEEIGRRFRRSPRYIRQVEGLAHYTLALSLLEQD